MEETKKKQEERLAEDMKKQEEERLAEAMKKQEEAKKKQEEEMFAQDMKKQEEERQAKAMKEEESLFWSRRRISEFSIEDLMTERGNRKIGTFLFPGLKFGVESHKSKINDKQSFIHLCSVGSDQ